MVLVCYVISLDHVIKGSCDLVGGSPLMVSHHLAIGTLLWRYVFSGWRARFHMLLFKSGITVYIPLFISCAWSSNRRKIHKKLLPVRPKQRQEEINKKSKCKAFFLRQKCNKWMMYLALFSLLYWFFKNKRISLRLTVLTYITSANICDYNIFW